MPEIIRIKLGTSNCYIVKQDQCTILIDTGGIHKIDTLEQQLARHEIKPENISLVILTHRHSDHTGCAQYLKDQYHIRIAAGALEERRPLKLQPRDGLGRIMVNYLRNKNIDDNDIVPDLLLLNGQSLLQFGIPANIITLEGHTRDSIGVLFENGALICGDMFMHFFTPSLSHIATDFYKLQTSFNKLKLLGITTVYPGHGKPFTFGRMAKKI